MSSTSKTSDGLAARAIQRSTVLIGMSIAVMALQVATFTVSASAAPAAIGCTTPELAAALTTANADTTVAGATVTLPAACVYTLTTVGDTSDGPTGLPAITGHVTIVGNGATITRSAATGTPDFRILVVAAGGNLTLQSFTISGGVANDGSGGGGVLNRGTL
ncbi:MAG TPA: hypothetical protein VGN54_11370, partial [Mycobacteriales bacterium]|nr:hypothetical protein [Mycobacteriales bacterium]